MATDEERAIEEKIAELESQRAELAGRLAPIEREIAMRREFLAKLRGEEPPTEGRRGRLDSARSRLVLRVLDEAKEPLTRTSIQAGLERLGHEAELDDISSTLTYLRRPPQLQVRRVEGNRWELSRQH